MRVFIYIRVSTNQQSAQGSGIAMQRNACNAKADALKITERFVFIDAPVSGDIPFNARPGLSQALNTIKRGDIFITYSRDRIARKLQLALQFDAFVRARGVCFISVSEEIPESKSYSEFDSYAERQRMHIIASTQSALAYKAAQNDCVGNVPYGFKKSYQSSTLEKCEREQAIIAFVQELKLSGYSVRAILHKLNEKGYVGRTNKPLGLSQISNILKRNPVPLSVVTPSKAKKKRMLTYGLESDEDTGHVRLCRAEQEVIRLCKSLRAQQLTFKQIAEELTNQGYASRAGASFTVAQIRKITSRKNPEDVVERRKPHAPYGFRYNSKTNKLEEHCEEQEVLSLVANLRKKGCSLSVIAQELTVYGYKTRNGKIFRANHVSHKLKSIKVNSFTEQRAYGNLPYGFRYSDELNSLYPVPCPDEQVVVAFMRELYMQGYSLKGIARELVKHVHKTRVGTNFQPAQIARILKREDNQPSYLALSEEKPHEETT